MTTPPRSRPAPRHGAPADQGRPDPRQPSPRREAAYQPSPPPSSQPSSQPPPPAPAAPAPPRGDSGGLRALRVVTYVLTSLASLVFLVLVVYGAVKVNQLQEALSSNPLFGGGSSTTGSSFPSLPSQADVCRFAPTAPECGSANP